MKLLLLLSFLFLVNCSQNSIETRNNLIDELNLDKFNKKIYTTSYFKIYSLEKIKNDGKYYLKKLAEKYLSKDLIYRDKFYFPVPPLKILESKFLNYVKEILLSKSCLERGLYNNKYIDTLLLNPNSYFTFKILLTASSIFFSETLPSFTNDASSFT